MWHKKGFESNILDDIPQRDFNNDRNILDNQNTDLSGTMDEHVK